MKGWRRAAIAAPFLVFVAVGAAVLTIEKVKSDDRNSWNQALHETSWIEEGVQARAVSRSAPCSDSMWVGRVSWSSPGVEATDPRLERVMDRVRREGWQPSTVQPRDFHKAFGGRNATLSVVATGEEPIDDIVVRMQLEPRTSLLFC